LVVATKLHVPQTRPQTVERARLTKALEAAGDRRLTLVCAPAGYGKTTALTEWLAGSATRSVWVSLDAQDDDPRRLCAHLLAALDLLRPGAMDAAMRALRSGSDLLDTVVPLAVRRLRPWRKPTAIVLDDCHVLGAAAWELVATLLDVLPPSVRVVISARTPPPLELERTRAAGTLVELGPDELRFRPEECERLFNEALGLALDHEQLAAIEERVDGWAAGLSLVASSLPRERPDRDGFLRAFMRSEADVAEYLIEEVLDATDPRMRDFLCRTSILARMNGPLCAAVLDDPAAVELLEQVRCSNLFVTVLDADAGWLRYHHLFAALLERELRRTAPGLVPGLHGRASAWFEQEGLLEEAIDHASAAGDGHRAARLVYDGGVDLLVGARHTTVRSMLARIPEDRGVHGPFCEALDVLATGLAGTAGFELAYDRLVALEPHRDAPGVARLIDQMRASAWLGRVGESVERGWAALERYPEPAAIQLSIAAMLGETLWFAGESAAARELLEPRVDSMIFRNSRAWALAALARVALDERDAEHAERRAHEALALADEIGGHTAFEYACAHQALGAALCAQGRLDEAHERLAFAHRITAKLPGSIQHALTLADQADLQLARGERERARASAAAARAIVDRYPDVGVLTDRIAAVEAALARRRGDELLGTAPSAAELRILELLPGELTLREIGAELHVSLHTVKSHVGRLYRRLGATRRADAVDTARSRGII